MSVKAYDRFMYVTSAIFIIGTLVIIVDWLF